MAQLRAALQEQIHTMIKAVLKNLQYTGVFRKDHLALAWMSPGQSAKQLRMSCQEHVWTRVLTDSSQVATFGCIGPFCFETPECPCRGTEPAKAFSAIDQSCVLQKVLRRHSNQTVTGAASWTILLDQFLGSQFVSQGAWNEIRFEVEPSLLLFTHQRESSRCEV